MMPYAARSVHPSVHVLLIHFSTYQDNPLRQMTGEMVDRQAQFAVAELYLDQS
jgi:plasmid rolling circle replication initiator protein Rep